MDSIIKNYAFKTSDIFFKEIKRFAGYFRILILIRH